MEPSVSFGRRRFLALAGAAAAVAGTSVLPQAGLGAPAAIRRIWLLDPEWGAGLPGCEDPHAGSQSCHACRACHGHAAAKMWTSETLADGRRAHAYCKCLLTFRDVSEQEYVMIFGPPSGPLHRDEFDRRRDELFLPERGSTGGA